jgi:type II secretory pathway pseudopilin PulG
MNKLEKIDRQEQKTREKIAALQNILKQIDGARTEQENLQIVQQFRALKLSRDELYAFLGGGVLPPALLGAVGGNAEPETIYSQRGRKRNTAPDTDPQETDTENKDDESEDSDNEE